MSHRAEESFTYQLGCVLEVRPAALLEANLHDAVAIVLRDCAWSDTPFGHLNKLPRHHRAVTLAPDRDEALAGITRELKGYIRPGVMSKDSDPRSITLAAHASRDVGIQFIAPASVRDYDWPIGRYQFDVLGWTGRAPHSAPPDFARRHEITVDSRVSREIRWATTAPEDWWIELNDPHNAVGVRVGIQPRSGG